MRVLNLVFAYAFSAGMLYLSEGRVIEVKS